jgi:hypothetical protein
MKKNHTPQNDESSALGTFGYIALSGGVSVILYAVILIYITKSWKWEQRGQFGDMFGAVNALFTALTCAAALTAVWLQRRELHEAREQLERQQQQNDLTAQITACSGVIEALSRRELLLEHELKSGTTTTTSQSLADCRAKQKAYIDALESLSKEAGVMIELGKVVGERAEPSDLSDPVTEGDLRWPTDEEVFDEMRQVQAFSDHELRSALPEVRRYLTRFGITTLGDLKRLVRSTSALDFLKKVYVSELKRKPEGPLDPVAVSTWAAILFRSGDTNPVRSRVLEQIRRSPEWRQKNPDPTRTSKVSSKFSP